ncbi:hypothetical protein KM043_013944 [Ampulex compressa]|nr:hypothetical protein KM043_013944 [Ampulex compressa]
MPKARPNGLATFGLALAFVLLWAFPKPSDASAQCKTIVMDVLMKRCRLGPRIKRNDFEMPITAEDLAPPAHVRRMTHFDMGLGLDSAELEELYNEITERLPRAPKDDAWKIFLDTAAKCCQNSQACLKEARHVSCMGF